MTGKRSIHFFEVDETGKKWIMCGKNNAENTTQNAIYVSCDECKEVMKIAGTFHAYRLRLERHQNLETE